MRELLLWRIFKYQNSLCELELRPLCNIIIFQWDTTINDVMTPPKIPFYSYYYRINSLYFESNPQLQGPELDHEIH